VKDRRFTKSGSSFAIPLDCFRIGTGILSFLYFVRAFYEAPYFLEQDSLINHQLVQNIFWYTWQPLFYPSMSTTTVQIILSIGMLFSLSLVIGFRSRFFAFILYIMVVCLYRYQFLVLFVDDVIMHLLLFWCFLLPTGKTLNLLPWLRNKEIMDQWMETKTDSFVLNLFLYNIALIYFVAGISKTSSRLWLEGIALLAVLKLPMGWFSNYMFESHEMWLRFGNYLALTIEPMFIFLVLLRPWNKVKMILGLSLALFHLFIILTLDVPFANLGCLILVPIIFREELMDLISKYKTKKRDFGEVILANSLFAKILSSFMVVFLTGAMTCALTQDQWRSAKRVSGKDSQAEVRAFSADTGGKLQTFFYSGLWMLGLAQGYRLLDWIDERNFHQTVNVIENNTTSKKEYGRSSLVPIGMRGSLILTYISDVTWMYVDPDQINGLRQDIRHRLSGMYCKKLQRKTDVEVWHSLTRVDSFQLKYNQPEILLKFSCEDFKTLVI
jgi:hypothetical protein